jgi:hypothetical protein
MKRFLHARPSPAMVVASAALFVALSGVGYAAIVLPAASVGTTQLKRNAVTSAKVKRHTLVRTDFKPGQVPKAARWATVDKTGTILRQSGGITAAKVQTGGYAVTFPEAVTGQLILVTPALAGDPTTRGAAIAGPCVDFAASCASATIANSVSVFTLSTTGTQQDHAFTVSVVGPGSSATSVTATGAARSQRWLDSGR